MGEGDPHGSVEGAPIELGDGQGATVTLAVPLPGEPPDPGYAREGP